MKVKVCFKCRKYTPIHDTSINTDKLEKFDELHKGHPTQIVNIEELDNSYNVWIPTGSGVYKILF